MQLPDPVATLLTAPIDIYEAHPQETREVLVAAAVVVLLVILL